MSDLELTPGTVLHDRYRVVGTLGKSRVATTYEAADLRSGERCVIKELSVAQVIRTSTGEESYSGDFTKLIELFEREARVLANLHHPGVPRLVDHFAVEEEGHGRLYTVQEFVEGKTLASLVEGGRHFSEAEVVALARKVASILAHLHELSPPLVHRDIKPSNIMLSEDGEVHLIDFGAVKTTLQADDLGGQTVVGTFGYMPMEQYEARALPASDVYALGATLIYLLSHKAPHELPRRGVKLAFRDHVNVSDGLARVLERMVEPAPEDRFPDADAALEALASLGRRPTKGAHARAAGRPLVLALAGVAGLVLVTGGVAWLALTRAAAPVPSEPPAAPEVEPPHQPPGGVVPVRPVDGVLTVDIYRDFRYVAEGWPMGRSVGQTGLGVLRGDPREKIVLPAFAARPDELLHGSFTLGNGADPRIALLLAREGDAWELWVDRNNDEDLSDDGPPLPNQGSGEILAARVFLDVEVVSEESGSGIRPYDLWVWFSRSQEGRAIEGRFYGTNHWAGMVEVDGMGYAATAFEFDRHDALYRDAGLCVDLNLDGKCQEDGELFLDGDVVPFSTSRLRLRLLHP